MAAAAPTRGNRWLGWLGMALLLVIVAVAGAGLVIALDHPASGPNRPELTARAHALLGPRIEAIDPLLARLGSAANTIEGGGRDVLGAIRDRDPVAVVAALDQGDSALPELQASLEQLRVARARLLDGVASDRLPQADRDRVETLDSAIAAGGELPAAWADVTLSAALPVRFLRASERHDDAVARSVELGRAGRFADAVEALDDADRALDDLRAVRSGANSRELDVTTLDDLLSRMAVHDAALRRLYQALADSNGEMTDAARRAQADEEAARRLLPDTTDPLVVVTSDLGGADATAAVIRIERAGVDIDAAVSG
jgi:hypothetical protein